MLIPKDTTCCCDIPIWDIVREKNFNIFCIFSDFQKYGTIEAFKKQITTLIRPMPKSIFGIHDSIGLKYLFQLRLGLSLLKYDKKRHNFVDTPNDLCECHCASEDIKHFFFNGHLFRQQRIKLFESVLSILFPYPNITF